MPEKLAKNLKIRAAHSLNKRKVFTSVVELLMDYDGSDTTKDKIKRITITQNEKLATLEALDESILAAIDELTKFRTGDRGIWRSCQVAEM